MPQGTAPEGLADRAVLLSGEHATLPEAELRALLAVHAPQATLRVEGPVAFVTGPPTDVAAVDAAAGRMAFAHAWMEPWAQADDDEAGHRLLADAVAKRATGKGTAGVSTERRGHAKSASSMALARLLGGALAEAGHRIELAAPEVAVACWLIDGQVLVGRRLGSLDRSSYGGRQSDQRAHFKPVGLHPRMARALVHLARVPPGGRVLDPFCGTGGFLLEASLDGYDAVGSDLDAFMVQGTLQALADDGPEPLAGTAFVADIAQVPDLVDGVDGIVTDLPYGRSSTTNREALGDLYARALDAFARLLAPGALAVVGHHDVSLLQPAQHGFAILERHEERVHKSLTRQFVVLQRLD